MIINENWAVSLERAQQFFLSQPDVVLENEIFYYKSCRITLEKQKSSALWNLPRIQLHITGEDADVQEIHRRFFLRFLTAGG